MAIVGDNTVNLASIVLDLNKKCVLKKGLQFIQTPQQVNKDALVHDGKQFARNIKLAYFLDNKTNHGNDSPQLSVPKSSWDPPDNYLHKDIKS